MLTVGFIPTTIMLLFSFVCDFIYIYVGYWGLIGSRGKGKPVLHCFSLLTLSDIEYFLPSKLAISTNEQKKIKHFNR